MQIFNNLFLTTRWHFAIVFCLLSSCATESKISYKKIVDKSKISNYVFNTIKYDSFKIKLNNVFNEKNTQILDSVLGFENVLILFDSNGNIKDLVGGNFTKNFESISLAIDYFNFARPIDVSTLDNPLPAKLKLNLSDLKSVTRTDMDLSNIIDKNKVYMMIVPFKIARTYKRRLKKFNLPKVIMSNNFNLILLTKEK